MLQRICHGDGITSKLCALSTSNQETSPDMQQIQTPYHVHGLSNRWTLFLLTWTEVDPVSKTVSFRNAGRKKKDPETKQL